MNKHLIMKKYSIMKTEARYAIEGFVTKSFIMAISETFNTRHAAEIALQKLLQKEVKKR